MNAEDSNSAFNSCFNLHDRLEGWIVQIVFLVFLAEVEQKTQRQLFFRLI